MRIEHIELDRTSGASDGRRDPHGGATGDEGFEASLIEMLERASTEVEEAAPVDPEVAEANETTHSEGAELLPEEDATPLALHVPAQAETAAGDATREPADARVRSVAAAGGAEGSSGPAAGRATGEAPPVVAANPTPVQVAREEGAASVPSPLQEPAAVDPRASSAAPGGPADAPVRELAGDAAARQPGANDGQDRRAEPATAQPRPQDDRSAIDARAPIERAAPEAERAARDPRAASERGAPESDRAAADPRAPIERAAPAGERAPVEPRAAVERAALAETQGAEVLRERPDSGQRDGGSEEQGARDSRAAQAQPRDVNAAPSESFGAAAQAANPAAVAAATAEGVAGPAPIDPAASANATSANPVPLEPVVSVEEPVAPGSTARPLPPEAVPQHVEWLAARGGGSAQIQLYPPELGRLQVQVTVRGNDVKVVLNVKEVAAQTVVAEYRDSLDSALGSKDLKLDGFEVRDWRDRPEGQARDSRGDGEQKASHERRSAPGEGRATGVAGALSPPSNPAHGFHPDQAQNVNLRV